MKRYQARPGAVHDGGHRQRRYGAVRPSLDLFRPSDGRGLFALFGLVFVLIAVAQAVYNFKNATGKNRYSAFDITDSREEPDPLNLRFGQPEAPAGDAGETAGSPESAFCPFCGTPVEADHVFCLRCGRKLP